jgi:hypothetical protein
MMIVLRPDEVEFDGDAWGGVVRVAIDRLSAQTLEEYEETGSFATLVDVVRQRVVIKVMQEIGGDDLGSPIPGALGQLTLVAGSGSDVGRRKICCDCVVESVENRITDLGASRSITLIAQSDAGDSDPVTVVSL